MLGRLKPSCKHLWHLVSTTVSCNAVLAESPRVITDKLQRVMNPAARVVTNTRKYDSGLSRLMHDELHWLDVTDRVRFKLAVLMYRCLHGTAPPYLMDSCILTAEVTGRQHLRSATQRKLVVPRYRLSIEQFRSSALFCGGPVDLEFAARQSS